MPKKHGYLLELQVSFKESEYQNILREQVREPEQLYRVFKSLEDETQEKLIGVYVSRQLDDPFYRLLSLGSDNAALCDYRYLFQLAYLTQAHAFALIHNHPSGDPSPSDADKSVMKEIQDQCDVLGFQFLDFMIIGRDGYWSLYEDLGKLYQIAEAFREHHSGENNEQSGVV